MFFLAGVAGFISFGIAFCIIAYIVYSICADNLKMGKYIIVGFAIALIIGVITESFDIGTKLENISLKVGMVLGIIAACTALIKSKDEDIKNDLELK